MKLEQVEPFVWRVPQGSVPGMRVPGIVFATEAMATKAVEDRAVEQVAQVATLPGIVEASYAMPDIHWGYGFPIGGVAATDPERGGVVSPGGVGFDISCGVRLVRSELEWERDASGEIGNLVNTLGRLIPRGVGKEGRMRLSRDEVGKVLRDGVGFPLSRGIGWEEDAEYTEDHGVLEDARPEHVSERAVERGANQLGGLGAGNHFLEIQVVDEVFDDHAANAMGLFAGQVCVMMHSGSRGVGHQVCTDSLKRVDEVMRSLGIDVPDRQLSCVPLEHDAAREYLGGEVRAHPGDLGQAGAGLPDAINDAPV